MPQEKSSSHAALDATPSHKPVPMQQSETSMASVPEKHCLSSNKALRVAQWLAQVEPGEEDEPFPSTESLSTEPPSTTTSASPSLESNAEPATRSVASDKQVTTMPAPPPTTQQFDQKYVRAGAMLGIGGSGGWMPPSYERVRVPVAATGAEMPAQSNQCRPSSSASIHGGSEQPQTRDQSSARVDLEQPNTNAQNTSKSV